MDFLKAHGTGNDFVVFVDPDDTLVLSDSFVRALCDRHTGIGADGVIRIGAPRTGGEVFMDYRNADGSAVEMCGNGVRVVAKIAVDHGIVPATDDLVAVDTRAGVKPVTVRRDGEGRVVTGTVDMGPPVGDLQRFRLDGRDWTGVSMGNPHAITLVEDVATAPVTTLGPTVETDPSFAAGTNVEFARVVDRRHIDLRVWERGVGETAACGTGACATLVALRHQGLVDDEATIRVPGGELTVRYAPAEHPSVFLTGPAEVVATGRLDPDWLAARGQ
jgi:diaminopimelate epimerase